MEKDPNIRILSGIQKTHDNASDFFTYFLYFLHLLMLLEELIHPKYHALLAIYSKEIPDFLLPFLEAKTIQRIADISQMCGTGYCKYYDYLLPQSRLDHSMGVALIIWHFTKDKKQTLAGFFHDVSHSVFSHVGDFLLGDSKNQESSEKHTTNLLLSDEIIMSELTKLGIRIDEVDDYTKYTIADNTMPKLSADRFEYTLSGSFVMGTRTAQDLKKFYDDVTVFTNEIGEAELGFSHLDIGEQFGLLSIENCAGCFSSYESVIAMSFLSEILRLVLQHHVVEAMDLYTLTETEIIDIIKQTKEHNIAEMRAYYTHLSEYRIHRYEAPKDRFFVNSKVKRRYIDPLIQTKTGIQRLSQLSESFVRARDIHLQRQEERISINYRLN